MVKSLELLFRRFLLLLLRGKIHKNLPNSVLEDALENPKILFLRHDKIGDVLITIPTIRILRKHLPTAHISILLSLKNLAVAPYLRRYTDSKFVYTKKLFETLKLLKSIRAEKFDVIIDCIDNPSTTSRMIIRLANARYSVGLESIYSGFYTHSIQLPDKSTSHIVERTAMLLKAFGICAEPSDLDLEYIIRPELQDYVNKSLGEKKKTRLAVNIAAGWEKYWGQENFRRLIQKLESEHIEIIGFATAEFQSELLAISHGTMLQTAPPASDFDEFAAMLSSCDVLFTPDTSVVHLAAAWKIPCLVLYANIVENMMLWTPFRSKYRAISTKKPQLSSISPDEVLIVIKELIADFPEKV